MAPLSKAAQFLIDTRDAEIEAILSQFEEDWDALPCETRAAPVTKLESIIMEKGIEFDGWDELPVVKPHGDEQAFQNEINFEFPTQETT